MSKSLQVKFCLLQPTINKAGHISYFYPASAGQVEIYEISVFITSVATHDKIKHFLQNETCYKIVQGHTSEFHWHCGGTLAALSWHCGGTLAALWRHSRGTVAALSWHSGGTLAALSWHSGGTLMRHSRGTLVAPSWHCHGTLVALSWHSRVYRLLCLLSAD